MNIEAMKKELFEYMVKIYNEYLANKTVNKYKIKYLTVYRIYYDIDALKDETSIRTYAHNLFGMSKTTRTTYDSLYSRYSKETNPTLKQKLLIELNECGAKLNGYNESYNIVNKHLNKKVTVTPSFPVKKETPSAPVKKETPVKKEKPVKKEEPTPASDLTSDDTVISDKIIGLLERCNDLDKNTSEAKKILEEIYRLRVEREEKFKELYGDQYKVFISELESYENMASNMPSEGFKQREIDSGSYILELRTALNAINEYHFMNELQIKKYYKKDNNLSDGLNNNRNFKKYNNFLRKFHVLIKSLFGTKEVIFKVDNIEVSSEDLLAYLGTCNLDGDYSVYKNKFNGAFIGTEDTNRKKYIETLTFLKKCIDSLCEEAKKKLKDKITITDTEMTKEDIIKKRNKRLKEIYYLKSSGRLDNRGVAHERK